MDLEKIIADLKTERDRLDQAIALLSPDSAAPKKSPPKRATPGRQAHAPTPAGRNDCPRRCKDARQNAAGNRAKTSRPDMTG